MQLEKFSGPGSTPKRRKFWQQIADAVIASQKIEGKNVSVDEREGYGSVIHANPQRDNSQGIGACCIDGECSLITATECSDAGGNFLGVGTTCDGIDCTQGACCDGGDCTLTTEEECPGTFQGYGTVCDPNPCELPTCECSPFTDDELPGRFFMNKRHEECVADIPSLGHTNDAWAEYTACDGCVDSGGPGGTSLDCGGDTPDLTCVSSECVFFCSDGFFLGGACLDEPSFDVSISGTTVTHAGTCNTIFGGVRHFSFSDSYYNECVSV